LHMGGILSTGVGGLCFGALYGGDSLLGWF
jgi:hypothetical protein